MKALSNYQCEGQLTMFDVFDLDILSTKTYPEPLVLMGEKILEPYSKKPAKLLTKTPMFLDLRKGKDGRVPDVSWVTDIRLLGESMMQGGMEFHKEESDYVYSLIMGGVQHQRYYLNLSEKPMIPKPSKLSQILESNPNPKYNLSPRACQGILNRAEKRGKVLPELLRIALERQAQGGGIGTFDVRISSEGTKNQRAHCYETDRSRALDTGGENPDSNHGGIAIVEHWTIDEKMGNTYCHCEEANTLGARDFKQPQATVQEKCLNPWDIQSKHIQNPDGVAETLYSGETRWGGAESYVLADGVVTKGNGDAFVTKDSHMSLSTGGGQAGQGYPCAIVGADMYNQTLTGEETMSITGAATDPHHVPCVVSGVDCYNLQETGEVAKTITSGREDKNNIPCVACYTQDSYDKLSESENSASLRASGGNYGGGYRDHCDTVGALCARDFKGVGTQYVNEGKVIVQRTDGFGLHFRPRNS